MTAGRYGKNGATGDKKEGDKKTPLGTYRFTMAFGVKENPGSILPYHQLTDTDYWVDDPGSSHYNQLVDSSSTKKAVSYTHLTHILTSKIICAKCTFYLQFSDTFSKISS